MGSWQKQHAKKKKGSLLDTHKEKTTLCVWHIFVLSLTSFL